MPNFNSKNLPAPLAVARAAWEVTMPGYRWEDPDLTEWRSPRM